MITSRSTRRLARSYLLVIMVLSLLFSGIIFAVVSAQLDRPFAPHRQLSPAESEQQFHQRWQRHNQEARQSVIMGLVVLNGLMLVGGAALSIVLARRTLRPIEQAHIFDRFYRTDTARTRTHISGHGLGLAIARQIAIQYGWRLGVVSQPGQGATFMLQISQADKVKREATSPQKQS